MSEGTGHAPAGGTAPYRVLARKYRPQSFADLIGQEALVRTLTNAIETDRLPHAVVLTGVRGVGKTTTARIIAKAINYAGPDGSAGPTVGPTDDCPICQAIADTGFQGYVAQEFIPERDPIASLRQAVHLCDV